MQDGDYFTATQLVRAGQNDQVFCKWPPRSPDLIVCDFFLWRYVKDRVYVPPLPANVHELQERITAAVNSVTPDMLQRVWSELKKIFKWKPLTKRSQGRPKYRWEDNITQDICQIKIKSWIACVQDRGTWKEVVEKARTFN